MNTAGWLPRLWLALGLWLGCALRAWAQPAAVAPTITAQPASAIRIVDQAVSFRVTATGTPAPTYQWRRNGSAILGATSATFDIANVQRLTHAGTYTVTVTNSAGSVTSANAVLTVVQGPISNGVSTGSSLSFNTAATGGTVSSYQWRQTNPNTNTPAPISGATGATLILVNLQLGQHQTRYDAVVTAPGGTLDTPDAELTVFAGQPQESDTEVGPGESVSFNVQAPTGSTYQWRKDTVPIAGATQATYTMETVGRSDDGFYSVAVITGAAITTSLRAKLTVRLVAGFPDITLQPVGRTVNAGTAVSFVVTATGTPAPTYQWQRNGNTIAGATGATYVIPSAAVGDAGDYTVTVTNSVGTLKSRPATLAVTAVNPGRLANLSVLARVTATELPMTVGTVVGGAGTNAATPKALLVRVAGPSLTGVGVPAATILPDPRLELFREGVRITLNDNWDGTAALMNAFAQVGAFAFTGPASLDAAVFSDAITPGGHTVQVGVPAGGSGTVIAEIYDATPGAAFTATTPRLINLSVLKQIDAGGMLTVGFVIGGGGPRTVLIRAVGPTLGPAPFNVPGAMADPQFQLFRGQTMIGQNDNWGGGAMLATAFGNVGAFGLPATSRDAALLVTLDAGNYSAQVSGVGGTGGVALVEVYEAP